MNNINDPKRRTPQRPKERHSSHAPQDKLQVEILAHVPTIIRLTDRHGQDGIGDHPRDDHVRAHRTIIVFLLLSLAGAVPDMLKPIAEIAQGFVVAGVDIELFRGHFELDGVVAGAGASDGGAEVDINDIVAFGAPGDVVGVAEGVDLQGADVGGEKGEVLR